MDLKEHQRRQAAADIKVAEMNNRAAPAQEAPAPPSAETDEESKQDDAEKTEDYLNEGPTVAELQAAQASDSEDEEGSDGEDGAEEDGVHDD